MSARPLPQELLEAPFRTRGAYAAGITSTQLRGPAVRRVFTGAYLPAGQQLTLRLLVASALLVAPSDAVVTGVTALRCRGIAVGPLEPVHLATTHPHPVRRRRLRVTRLSVLPSAPNGVVAAEEAFVSAAAALDLVELVIAGDHLVRTGQATPATLLAAAARFRGRSAVLARRAADLVRPRVDSPRETELRLCLVLAGLPEPECNPVVGSAAEAVGRVDLRYRKYRLLLEYEGDQHRTSPAQWNRDIERHERLTALGETVVRVTAARMSRPRGVVIRVLQALRIAGYPGPDPVFSAEWMALFDSTVREARRGRAFGTLPGTVEGST